MIIFILFSILGIILGGVNGLFIGMGVGVFWVIVLEWQDILHTCAMFQKYLSSPEERELHVKHNRRKND